MAIILHGPIERRILIIRGQKVLVDHDLAQFYGVQTKYLNRQVRRNISRFPKEFMFRLSRKEHDELVTNWHQFKKLKHSYSLPYAFTEHGIAMLSSVLKSDTAVQVSIHIIKTFIRLRKFATSYNDLSGKLAKLEEKVGTHDREIRALIEAIREMTAAPQKPKREIGFHAVYGKPKKEHKNLRSQFAASRRKFTRLPAGSQ